MVELFNQLLLLQKLTKEPKCYSYFCPKPVFGLLQIKSTYPRFHLLLGKKITQLCHYQKTVRSFSPIASLLVLLTSPSPNRPRHRRRSSSPLPSPPPPLLLAPSPPPLLLQPSYPRVQSRRRSVVVGGHGRCSRRISLAGRGRGHRQQQPGLPLGGPADAPPPLRRHELRSQLQIPRGAPMPPCWTTASAAAQGYGAAA